MRPSVFKCILIVMLALALFNLILVLLLFVWCSMFVYVNCTVLIIFACMHSPSHTSMHKLASGEPLESATEAAALAPSQNIDAVANLMEEWVGIGK